MAKRIVRGFLKVIIKLSTVLLSPLDSLIGSFIPGLSDIFTAIGQFFTVISNSLGWVVSLSGLSGTAISFIVIYYTFKLTAPIASYMIKLAIKWYNAIKI